MEEAKIPQKRIKVVEEEDRISLLPDCLIIGILSRLPSTKSAIITSTLSKRWVRLWTYVPRLFFDFNLDKKPSITNFFLSVDKAVTQSSHHLNLQKFEVNTSYDKRFESQLGNWIRYAINRNTQELTMILRNWNGEPGFMLDHEALFINSCITDLSLSGFRYNPSCVISWKNLKSLCLLGKLDEDLIENILSGSPLLETLNLEESYGYKLLDITSKSVKNFRFSGQRYHNDFDEPGHIIKINAPNLMTLTIRDYFLSWKLLLLDASSLVKAELDYMKGEYYLTKNKVREEEMLEELILSLCHVKKLQIGRSCFKVLSRLEDKGFIMPSNM